MTEKFIDTQYEELLKYTLENGELRGDRTGTGTISCWDAPSLRYDMSNGFPLITTKKVFTRGIFEELLWFLSGDTNVHYLRDVKNVHIWDDWADSNGDLGPIYSNTWRALPSMNNGNIIEVKKRIDKFADYEYAYNELIDPIEFDLNNDELWAIEKIESDEAQKNSVYKVQFKSGYIKTLTRVAIKQMTKYNLSDRYAKNVAGVGFLGEPVEASDKLYELWYNMINRCYNTNNPNYKYYGAKGVTVSPVWHSFEMFVKTLSMVPLSMMFRENESSYHLDKDYFGSNTYSPNTTIFLPNKINKSLSKNGTAISLKGKKYSTWKSFQKATGIRADYIKTRLLAGDNYKEYTPDDFELLIPREGYLYRQEVYVDQIEKLIENVIKDPYSRRHIVDAWYAPAIDKQALTPCHNLFQVYVTTDGRLNLKWMQRSSDEFLGLAYNIASYSLLLHMIAQQTNLEPGILSVSFGDAHIYSNHVDQVKLQLSRKDEAFVFPDLKILRKPDSIFDYKYEDFEIVGYQSHDAIKAPIAV